MNFIFISPNFPENYYLFCKGLKENGVRVLAIGEQPYNELKRELKEAVDEYYYVNSLENYDEKYRAVAFFAFKYGRIDFLESNNEYWLEDDARLRSDFNISTGPKDYEIEYFKSKRKMKEYYKKAGIKTARYTMVKSFAGIKKFVEEVGYPVVVKPDNGVGAAKTYKLKSHEDLVSFYETYDRNISYIMEEFIDGELISFDGVCDSKSNVVYPTHHLFPTQVMEVVNEQKDVFYYTEKEIPNNVFEAGQKVLKAFKAKQRFYHLEFFILSKDKEGLGKKGEIIGLEVNMRVPGGFTTDMINYGHSINIYKIWADMIVYDKLMWKHFEEKKYCAYYGRRSVRNYMHNHNDIMNIFSSNIKMVRDMSKAFAVAMGDYFYIAVFDNYEEMMIFKNYMEATI